MLHQTFLFLGQLWQLFEVSQILEFLRYCHGNIEVGLDSAWHWHHTLKVYDKLFFSVMGKGLSGKLSCTRTDLVSKIRGSIEDNSKMISYFSTKTYVVTPH